MNFGPGTVDLIGERRDGAEQSAGQEKVPQRTGDAIAEARFVIVAA
jgi:hypothetical protein